MPRLTKFELDAMKEMIGQLSNHYDYDLRVQSYTGMVERNPKIRRALDRFCDTLNGNSRDRFNKAYTSLLGAVDDVVNPQITADV